MTEPQIKIMKLSSGEEIVSELVADEHPRTFNIKTPLKLTSIPKITERGIEESVSLQRWIHFAEGNTFDIPKTQVLVMTTASFGLSKFYEYCVKKMETNDLDDSDYGRDNHYDEDIDDDYEDFMEMESPSKVTH